MANTLTNVTPKLLAQGLMALRENAVMPMLVNSDYKSMAAQKGETINIPIPSAIAVQDVTPANTPPSTADVAPTSADIELNQWKEAPFYLTDKDVMTAMDGTIPMQASEAIKALGNNVDEYILGLYLQIYGYHGVAGTTPFVTDTSEATGVRKILNNQLAPLDSRRMVINADAEANALDLRPFQDMSFSGSALGIIEGQINRKLGFDWFMDQNVPDHTAGTITTGLTVTGVNAIGTTTLGCTTAATTGACALLEGDIVSIVGDTQTYVLTADATQAAASTAVNLLIQPGLQVATAGSEAVTVKASHAVNLAFHRDCFAFASRPLVDNTEGLGNIIQSATDPVTGLSLRLEVSREHKRTRFSYDILYGADVVRAELGARMPG